jgi:hypothetical protein
VQDFWRLNLKPTVLLLSTYPFTEPRHGGQIRLANISKAYTDDGWKVVSVAVYEQESYSAHQVGKNDIPMPANSPYRQFHGRYVPLINDILSGQYAAADDGGFPSIQKRLPSSIQAIHVEQPWLWPVAARLKTLALYSQALLIFGSQNIEAPLKENILESYNVVDGNDVLDEISALEKSAALDADITLAVTRSDLETLIGWGAKNTLLAPNCVTVPQASSETIERWKQRLPKEPWILYVASAHPPNFTGFTKCIGESLGCISPTSRLVVAGSVCEHLYNQLSATRWSSLNLSRLDLIWCLSDEDLSAVRMLAHAYMLPILHGGGSNIKTAEALYSGAYVIGTEEAFRGFEDFLELPEVLVARSPVEFQQAVRYALSSPSTKNGENRQLRETLRWDHCVASVPRAASDALKNKAL